MELNFILAQCIGFIVAVLAIVSMQFKSIRLVLISQIVLNVLSALNYALLGGLSGAWICILATVQTAIMFFLDGVQSKNIVKIRNMLLILFVAAYIIGTIIVYKDWNDIVSCVCAILFVLSIIQTDSAKYRKFILANATLWIIYDITTMAYTSILTHGFQIASILIAMVRVDHRQKKSNDDVSSSN